MSCRRPIVSRQATAKVRTVHCLAIAVCAPLMLSCGATWAKGKTEESKGSSGDLCTTQLMGYIASVQRNQYDYANFFSRSVNDENLNALVQSAKSFKKIGNRYSLSAQASAEVAAIVLYYQSASEIKRIYSIYVTKKSRAFESVEVLYTRGDSALRKVGFDMKIGDYGDKCLIDNVDVYPALILGKAHGVPIEQTP